MTKIDNIPKEKQGDIQKRLRENPQIELKRKLRALLKLEDNKFAFKHGKRAKKLSLYCNNCYAKAKCQFYQEPKKETDKVLCALHEHYSKWFSPEEFDYREENEVYEVINKLVGAMLHRLAIQLYFEALDGGVQDKSATKLAIQILDFLEKFPK